MSYLEMDISDSDEEEEEEMMFLVFPALYLLSKKNKTPMNTSILTGPKYIQELLDGHPTRCYDVLRMESDIFEGLANYLRSKNLLQNSRGVSVEEQLGMLMYMMSRNASYRTLADRFQRSPETIFRHINACIDAITSLATDFVKPSSMEPHCKISSTPQFWPYFEEDSKLRKYEGKSFPLFEALDLLYEGNIAQGKLCFTTSQPPNSSSNRKHQRDESYSTRNLPPRVDRMTSQRWESSSIEDEIQNSRYDVDKRDGDEMPRDHFDEEVAEDGDEVQEIQRSGDHANSRSGISGVQSTKGKKQKGNSSFSRIEQTMSEYVNLKKEQVIMKEQASKQGQQYSIPRCLEVLNAMDDVSDDIKVLASDVFKDAANRELFLCYDSKLRGLWLKKEVVKLGVQLPP